ncbi:MAG: hypothetical protein MUF66_11400 [Gammaproteobacteria bacterium]|nr:hypothetical protein [Gammaproteobacteria bacterium]
MRSDEKTQAPSGAANRVAAPGEATETGHDAARRSEGWRAALRAVPKGVWISVAFLAIVALAFGVKRYLDTRVAWGYTLIDSKVPAADHQMYWIDNDRVLFLGGELIREGEHFGKYKQALMIFDVGKRESSVYRSESRGNLCYSEGYVMYTAEEQGEKRRFAGEFGEEVHTPWLTKEQAAEIPDARLNYLTCRVFDYGPYKKAGKTVKPLRDGDGYLELGPPVHDEWTYKTPIRLVRGLDGVTLDLPIERRQTYHVHYAPFRGDYFLMRFINQNATIEWSGKGCEPIWWLRSDGGNEQECLPYLRILSLGLGHVVPWRDGVLFAYHRGVGQLSPGDGGLYVWKRYGLPRRVLPGVLSYGAIGHPAVSPDGCRVAFGYARDMSQDKPPTRTLRVLELCEGGYTNGQGSPQSDRITREP